MSHADVYKVVSEVVPCVHMEWGDQKAPKLPWAVYYGDERPVLFADDEERSYRNDWTVELYEEHRDKVLEKKLGDAIRAKFGSYVKRESWVAAEKCLLVTYDFHEIEGVNNG